MRCSMLENRLQLCDAQCNCAMRLLVLVAEWYPDTWTRIRLVGECGRTSIKHRE